MTLDTVVRAYLKARTLQADAFWRVVDGADIAVNPLSDRARRLWFAGFKRWGWRWTFRECELRNERTKS
jgi:hypothetical protein